MYGGATLVGLSRMYHNNHWASDVVLGAAIGTFSGLKVVRYSHAHPDNKLDKFILGATVFPNADGGPQYELVELVVRVGVGIADHFQAAERPDRCAQNDIARPMVVVIHA